MVNSKEILSNTGSSNISFLKSVRAKSRNVKILRLVHFFLFYLDIGPEHESYLHILIHTIYSDWNQTWSNTHKKSTLIHIYKISFSYVVSIKWIFECNDRKGLIKAKILITLMMIPKHAIKQIPLIPCHETWLSFKT